MTRARRAAAAIVPEHMGVEQFRALKRAKPGKFRSKRETVDGISFDSRSEAQRYRELKLEERAGAIRNLKTQVRIPLIAFSISIAGGETIGHYKADFTYERLNRSSEWIPVVEDRKSRATAEKETWPRTRKIFRANYGFEISETRGRTRRAR